MQGVTLIEGQCEGRGLKVAVVAARFNAVVVEALLEGAVDALQEHGVLPADLTVLRVPGAWEIPVVLEHLAKTHDVLVALGAVVRGQTPHFDYVAGECARGVQEVSLHHGVPVGFGVLTTDNLQQAMDRAGGKAGNKGAEAALAALEVAVLLRRAAL